MFSHKKLHIGLNICHITFLQCGRIKPQLSSLTNVEKSTSSSSQNLLWRRRKRIMAIAKFFALQVNAISASQQMSLNQNLSSHSFRSFWSLVCCWLELSWKHQLLKGKIISVKHATTNYDVLVNIFEQNLPRYFL